jgi:hypothetical protein
MASLDKVVQQRCTPYNTKFDDGGVLRSLQTTSPTVTTPAACKSSSAMYLIKEPV